MAYSGTVGQTTISVQSLIDHGARRSGKLAEELTVEQVISAKESLFYILSNLINQGIQYFAIKKKVFGLIADQANYVLPVGGNDVLNALYRRMSRQPGSYASSPGGVAGNAGDSNLSTYCQQTAPNGNISVTYTAGVYAGSIGIMPAVSGQFHIIFEWSNDNITWNTLLDTGVETWVNGQWLWYDINDGANALSYRMRETGGNTMSVTEFYVGNNSTEITMSRLNRDDYTNLPNKNFTANQPFQFWFNRTIPQASIDLWPVPSDPFVQMTIWYSAYVEDVGALSGQLAIPDRWLMAIQNMLAHQMSQELPGVDLQRIQYLEVQAEKYFQMAEQEERDKSPIYMAPNVSVYTR
ncbi:hypothetical protein UFOVP35_8 [uncultured Caudovirales phage]|uniref:Uncharacterized protein n=1 Tax=uncultured Caudovirales phage TaxID=2100421 RepID=A0A6J5KMF0_9CAUD|nr:hypothetical protein UFOVP35_8 [uncultured Caudovirales phage]CAB4124607.1 hypothetical protein UFOVP52_39 [uncultured Caudovirales phage]CAB5219900.1 hypothetical protein UFOVP234_64 [uncultured Caudovirales phage]